MSINTNLADRALSIEESRTYLGGMSRQKVYDLINDGTLKTFKYGRRRFTRPAWISEALDKLSQPTAAQEPAMSTAIESRIRHIAQKQNLIAIIDRKGGLWRFADFDNCLVSSEYGLDDESALRFLLEGEESNLSAA